MKRQFAKTKNVGALLRGVAELRKRGAPEASWMLVCGEPGLGKTAVMEWWAVQYGAVYLRAKSNWTPAWALGELVRGLGLEPEARYQAKFAQALGCFARMPDGDGRCIVIDEMENTLHDHKILEMFRDLSDPTECTVILVGMHQVKSRLMRHQQISSRITQVVEFGHADYEDVGIMVDALVDGIRCCLKTKILIFK